MKILFFLLIIQSSFVYAETVRICSDKLNMVFSGSYKDGEKTILQGDGVLLTFDIDNIDIIAVYPVKFKDQNKKDLCIRGSKALKLGKPFIFSFKKPFNDHEIGTRIRKQSSDPFDNNLREYMLVVRKNVNGNRFIYHKIFTFYDWVVKN